MMEVMEEEAQELLSYFNHRNVEALLKVTRNTLEMLRKRIHTSSLVHFLGGSTEIVCNLKRKSVKIQDLERQKDKIIYLVNSKQPTNNLKLYVS